VRSKGVDSLIPSFYTLAEDLSWVLLGPPSLCNRHKIGSLDSCAPGIAVINWYRNEATGTAEGEFKMETMTLVKDSSGVYSERQLKEMFSAALGCLGKNADAINALNVFPVPDGDTGTNMLLTLRSAVAEADKSPGADASGVARAMATGALMGARGNSGVILSQILRGFTRGFISDSLNPAEMAEALHQAALSAREGTMLTVIKDAAAAAKTAAGDGADLAGLMEAVCATARESVERTPQLLEVLREAGVVDAGGQGIYVILEGMRRYLRGDAGPVELPSGEVQKHPAAAATDAALEKPAAYGFCTEMLIKDAALEAASIRRWVESMGESVLVVGDKRTTKIHVHTAHPGIIIEFALSIGTVHDLKIQNMDDQHQDLLKSPPSKVPATGIGLVAVASGDGLTGVFRSLRTTAIISGGQTMNPSCAQIVEAINSVPQDSVIVLPNNKNIIPAARQAASMSTKKVEVLPTRSVPEGLAALLAYADDRDLKENASAMLGAAGKIRSIEITRAVRDAVLTDVCIKNGEYIGLVDGVIRVADFDLETIVDKSLDLAGASGAEIATVYYGEDTPEKDAAELCRDLKTNYPDLTFEVISGGQPHYHYVISIE